MSPAPSPHSARRYLLLQIRNASDPMMRQEVDCFADALSCDAHRITVHDLLAAGPSRRELDRHDLVLIGGSGEYSAASGSASEGPWLDQALDALRELHAIEKPTFASCWGFQAFCRALGGACVHDLPNAELGPVELTLTAEGQSDPVFGELPTNFLGHAGHEDRVTELPAEAVLLASTARVPQQAIHFAGKPIYATQFHPELRRETFLQRIAAYPKYVEEIAGVPFADFRERTQETPAANRLLKLMAEYVLA